MYLRPLQGIPVDVINKSLYALVCECPYHYVYNLSIGRKTGCKRREDYHADDHNHDVQLVIFDKVSNWMSNELLTQRNMKTLWRQQ